MTVTNFIWDELSDNVLLETDDSGTVTAEYHNLPGPFGEPISRRVGFTEHYFHYDGLGSTRQLTNQVQTVTDTYTYSAFGETVASTGSTTNPFQFSGASGYYRDAETGDYYVRRRTYDPGASRWLSRDPLGFVDGPNVYSYVTNFVPNRADPNGQTSITKESKETNPGRFRVTAGNCGGEQYNNCCCSKFTARYYPSEADKVKFRKICIKVYSTYRASRQLCPFGDIFDDWEFDKPKDKQICWVPNSGRVNQSTRFTEWTDFPGAGPSSGEQFCPLYCRFKNIAQSWEACAVGTTTDGKKLNLGCVTYHHVCTYNYVWTPVDGGGLGGACRCDVSCTIERTGDIGNNIPPRNPEIVPSPYTGTEPDPDGH